MVRTPEPLLFVKAVVMFEPPVIMMPEPSVRSIGSAPVVPETLSAPRLSPLAVILTALFVESVFTEMPSPPTNFNVSEPAPAVILVVPQL